MRLAKENLGKVSVTVEKNYHSIDKEYDKLVVVEEEGQFRTFISRKPVPIGTELTDREFWLPFSSVKESIVIDYNKFKQYIRTGEGLLDDSIITRHIKNKNITGDKIAEETITFVNIANEAVTLPKINKEAIDTTLTKEGYLAEAKHTGERLSNVESLTVIKVPSTQSTVLDAWQIIDKKGNVHGVTINTYKDKSIDAIWLSIHEDDPQPENPEVKVDNPRYLNIVYNKANGTQQKVSIPLASFVTEAEFSKNGFKVIDGVVNLKISADITTSRYFHFDADGNITLDGFEERILEDLGTLEHSQSGDGTMWGEFKKQEAIREEVSNSAYQVFSDNWDIQDDDPELPQEKEFAEESSYTYNWKTADTPASDGKTEGNLKDLYQNILNQELKLSKLEKEQISVYPNVKRINETITISIDKDGKYVGWSDGIVYNFAPYAISNNIKLKKGDTLNYSCGANDVIAILAKVIPNSNKYIPLTQGGPNDSKRERTYIATENCEVVISYVKSYGIDCEISYYNIERNIADLEEKDQNLSNSISDTNINVTENTNNINRIDNILDSNEHDKVLNKYGNAVESEGWSYTKNYIPYIQGNQVTWRFSLGATNLTATICFYDSNYKKIENFVASQNEGENIITASNIPAASAYIRFSFKTSDIESVYCKIGEDKVRPSGLINNFDYYKTKNDIILSYKKNNVFYGNAIANTTIAEDLKKKILSAIKLIRIDGYSKLENLILKNIKLIAYSEQIPLYFNATISKINNDSFVDVCNFMYEVTSIDNWHGIVECKLTSINDMDVIDAKMVIDLDALGTTLFNITLASSIESNTFEKCGLGYDCIVPIRLETSIFTDNNVPIRYQAALRSIIINNLDTTRNYKLRKFGYNRNTGLLTIGFCTDENFCDILYQTTFDTSKAIGVKWVERRNWKALIDFSIMTDKAKTFSINSQSINSSINVCLLSGVRDSNLSTGEELTLTYDNKPLRLLDCGKNSNLFYLACERKLFTTKHITKQKYVANDPALNLVYEFDDTKTMNRGNVWEMVVGIYGVKELNNGKLLTNICIQTSTNEAFDNINRDAPNHEPIIGRGDVYSKFYMLDADGSSATFLFEGSWQGARYSDGWVKRGGGAIFIWDFYEWDNYIFISERNAQGLGGRAWMSKDYGTTWYLIFNAYGDNNWIYWNPPYPFTNPSGFDPEHGDFNRPGQTGRPNFHIHGIAYDHWRNQVIIVSGDSTSIQGSYTAVWVWKDPQNIELYPEQTYEGGYSGTEVYPLGGTKADNPVKMLKNTWKRVGLHQNDNTGMIGNMQFVGCIPFKDVIAFTTDCNVQGGNGIIYNTYPYNIISENFKIGYSLSADSEGNTLTHCGGGHMFVGNLCLATIHRENDNNIPLDSKREGAVLVSIDGKHWKRVFVDDTIDADKNTKIYWGATMIGKPTELYLRYKGYSLKDNVIRQMRLY